MSVAVGVIGCGRAHPPGRLTNAELETRIDTTDTWIRDRTGITSRWIGGTTTGLATEAARQALDDAGLTIDAIGLIVVATSTPDQPIPAAAALVARELGSDAGTMDVNGACAGFVYAYVSAASWVSLTGRPALVIGVDVLSRIVDPGDRGTVILFGDGAGAVVMAPSGDGPELLSVHSGSDATAVAILECRAGGFLHMDGQAVFKLAVRAAMASIEEALTAAGLGHDDIDLFVPHQANERITAAIAKRLSLDPSRVVSTIAETGNASAATIPYALSVAGDEGRLHPGDVVVLCGFGAGMTWATAVLRW